MSVDQWLRDIQSSLTSIADDREMRRAVVDRVRLAVPFDAFAWLLTDPQTTVGTAPLAEVPCQDRLPHLVALRYTSGQRWSATAAGVPYRPVQPGSELARFLAGYGSFDVLSISFADRFGCWGFLDLWRDGGRFTDEEAELIQLLAAPVATALRASRASAFVPRQGAVQPASWGQAVLLLGPDLVVRGQTSDAETDLRVLLPTEERLRPVPAAAYNVAAQLMAAEAGVDTHPPMARTFVAPGEWICVRAARLEENIAVTIGPLEQQERWSLFCRCHGLSDRETEVLSRLAEGGDTNALASQLHLSNHTVQDHLKSVFAKTGVNSRRELLARARGR